MSTATITTTGKLTSLAIGDGVAINLPARVPGIPVSTATALGRALEWETPEGIHRELEAHWRDAKATGATQEQVIYGFTAWLAMAGDWQE